MNRIAVVFVLFCALSTSFAFDFEDCGSEAAKFSDITISSCESSSEKCIMPRDVDITVSLKITPFKDISKLESRPFGVLLDVPIPIPVEKPDACKDGGPGMICPLKKDQEVEYKTSFVIEKNTPSLSVDIMWQFISEKDEKVLCIKFPARIK